MNNRKYVKKKKNIQDEKLQTSMKKKKNKVIVINFREHEKFQMNTEQKIKNVIKNMKLNCDALIYNI